MLTWLGAKAWNNPKLTRESRKPKKFGKAVSKLIIYERLSINLANSPRLYNLINADAELGLGVKAPPPYEFLEVYLEEEHKVMQSWIEGLKPTCGRKGGDYNV